MGSEGSADSATAKRILAAAARALRSDESASMEVIAGEAGVSRATVHRHFATRDLLVSAALDWASREVEQVFASAGREHAPLVVRLYEVTRALLATKSALEAILHSQSGGQRVSEESGVFNSARGLMATLRESGLLSEHVGDRWATHVDLGLLRLAAQEGLGGEEELDRLTSEVLDTFLGGVGDTSLRYAR